MSQKFSLYLCYTAENQKNSDDKAEVLKNLLNNLSDKDFSTVKDKIAKNPKLFKELVKYLKFI